MLSLLAPERSARRQLSACEAGDPRDFIRVDCHDDLALWALAGMAHKKSMVVQRRDIRLGGASSNEESVDRPEFARSCRYWGSRHVGGTPSFARGRTPGHRGESAHLRKSAGVSGFFRKSLAPAFIASTASSIDPNAVTMMTVAPGVFF